MGALNVTLVADGGSDRALVPLIERLLDRHWPGPFRSPNFVASFPSEVHGLAQRIEYSLQRFPCQLLCVHRDAERQDFRLRETEIRQAIAADAIHVCIVPVRMTEAWLLCDEAAIRMAVGNPRGHLDLELPRVEQIEGRDAKELLHRALRLAHGEGPRRMRRFRPEQFVHRIAELIESIEPLRQLPSFARFEIQLELALRALG